MDDKDYTELEEMRKACIAKIYICADNVLKHLENDKEKEIDELKSHVKHYCLYEEYPNMIEQVSEKNKNELDTSNVDKFEDKFKMDLKSLMAKMNVTNHPWMMELDKKIIQSKGIAGNLNMKDSITKRPIENPVCNKYCGHIYEKEFIIKHISIKENALCTVAGCGNKKPLRQGDLLSEIDSGCLAQQTTANAVHDVDMDSE